jgi:hypothetical protein
VIFPIVHEDCEPSLMNGIEDRVGGVDLIRTWKFEPTEDDLMAVCLS